MVTLTFPHDAITSATSYVTASHVNINVQEAER